jgi:hypothetical protein
MQVTLDCATHKLSENDHVLPPVNTIVMGTTNYTLQHDLNWAYADCLPMVARWKKFRGISTTKHEKTKSGRCPFSSTRRTSQNSLLAISSAQLDTSGCASHDTTDIKMQHVTGRQYFNCFSLMAVDFRLWSVLDFETV